MLAFVFLAGCGGRPPAEAPLGANEFGVTLQAGVAEVRWYCLRAGALPVSQVRVGVCEGGITNWTIVLWDGVWKGGWTSEGGSAMAPVAIRGRLAALPAGNAAARAVTVACTLSGPLRMRSALGEGFVPAGTYLLAADPAGADSRRRVAGLPVVMTVVAPIPTNGWFGRQFQSRQVIEESAYARRTGRLESRLFFIHPELRALIRKMNATLIARQNAAQPMHEIQAVLASHNVAFPPGAYVAEGPFTNSLVIRTTAAELNALDPLRKKDGTLLFGQTNPWKAGVGK